MCLRGAPGSPPTTYLHLLVAVVVLVVGGGGGGGGDGGVVYTLKAIPVTLSSTSSCLNLSVPIQHSNLL